MVQAITSAFQAVMQWIGLFVTALVGESGMLHDLLPVFVIGIGVSLLMLGIKAVKSMTWGA